MGLPAPTLIHIPDDFNTVIQKQHLRQYAEMTFPDVDLVRLDRVLTVKDPLYNEANDRLFQEPIRMPALVLHDPPKKTLLKYGLEQGRKLMVHITTMHLDEHDLLENRDDFLIGDTIHWGAEVFEIKDQTRDTESYWANTNIPFYLVLGCDYYRRGT